MKPRALQRLSRLVWKGIRYLISPNATTDVDATTGTTCGATRPPRGWRRSLDDLKDSATCHLNPVTWTD